MIKLQSIEVNNYKNIKHTKLELNNFNVIVGANNSGKSNFVQILSFLDHIINDAPESVEQTLHTISFHSHYYISFPKKLLKNKTQKGLDQFFKLNIHDENEDFSYTYILNIKWHYPVTKNVRHTAIAQGQITEETLVGKLRHKSGKAPFIFKRTGNQVTLNESLKKELGVILPSVSSTTSVFRLLKIFRTNKDGQLNKIIGLMDHVLKTPSFFFSNVALKKSDNDKSPIQIFKGRVIAFNLNNEISKIYSNTQKKKLLLNALQQILKIQKVEIRKITQLENDPRVLVLIHAMGQIKLLEELSDGSLNIIALIVQILNATNKIIIIEEPENSLHPKALQLLIQFIKSFDDEIQFIITTHSIVLLNYLSPENVIVAQCDENGYSDLVNISSQKELIKQLNKGYISFSDLVFFDAGKDELTFKDYGEEN